MKILITGANGFVGKNLVASLQPLGYEIYAYDRQNTLEDLKSLTRDCDFVVHLAGINRPKHPSDFFEGNATFTETLCSLLKSHNNKAPILISSSIQADLDNDYGQSKKMGEAVLLRHGIDNDSDVLIYRFSNLFGKWSRPNYNTVIATWCNNVAHGIDVHIDDPQKMMNFIYIDDVITEIIRAINGTPTRINDEYVVPISYNVSLGQTLELIQGFKHQRESLFVPNFKNGFERALYSTYLSFLPKDAFSYPLVSHHDDRGSFTEFVKSEDRGQVSINISKPGITKGNHWHNTKTEKFLVVQGEGLIQFRDVFETEIIEYVVSGTQLEVVDIPPGYTHNIINTGDDDMVTVMWVNEPFDPNNPDTFSEVV
ncbi:SDR family oxidoreductase [Erysipelothrix sp. HDW6C]|uniref:polysaccharide biosynthesis C-terminal domain-containing protein n=1 Tax=Erysipelothrix sp. HDW6C TaxID=2714930 RepID=UPI00140C3DD7|nr:NAD-dependent epimerase/dehydratase family protein [Erysipelothrix sp. HDW6C]QIK70042.1 SDR family oxidoreductase [Erysipelothrix sp. HDW6C]